MRVGNRDATRAPQADGKSDSGSVPLSRAPFALFTLTILVNWFVWRCECTYLEMDEFNNDLYYYMKMYYDYYQVNLLGITVYYDYFLNFTGTSADTPNLKLYQQSLALFLV